MAFFRLVIGVFVLFSSLVYGDIHLSSVDIEVQTVLQEVEDLFKQRSVSDPEFLDTILEKLYGLEHLYALKDEATNPDLKYDMYILESKILYWKARYVLNALLDPFWIKGWNCSRSDFGCGVHEFVVEGAALFTLGKAKADAAIQVNNTYAEGHYYSALHQIALGKYLMYSDSFDRDGAEKNLKEALKQIERAINNISRSGRPGEEIDGWGPNRAKGFLLSRWPFMMSYEEVLPSFEVAYNHARDYAENVVGYALNLVNYSNINAKYHPYNPLMAGAILNLLLSHDPKTYNPDRIEETTIEFKKAKFLQSLCNSPEWGGIRYATAKEGLQDYAALTKLEEDAASRLVNSKTQLDALNGERLDWIEMHKRQEKVFSAFDLLRSRIEDATPELIVKIQNYLATQQDTLQTILDNLNLQLKETQDPKIRDVLQYDIVIFSDLAIAKKNLGDNPEALKKAMNAAVNGDAEERAEALSYFDPLTQAILKWVFQTTPPLKENIFIQIKEEVINLQIFSKEHLSTIDSKIEVMKRVLQYAQDDQTVAQYIVKKVYEACQAAQGG